MITSKGYHTLEDRGNATQIEESGPIRAKRLNIAWLGSGYYFWDTEAHWAHDWGRQYGNYLVFEASIIRNEKVYDLFGEVKHIKEFLQFASLIREMHDLSAANSILVSEVIEYVKAHTKFNDRYSAIRCADNPGKSQEIAFRRDKPERMKIGGIRVQYCLFNYDNIINGSFKLVYPENL